MGQDRLALPIHCHGVAPGLLRSRHFRPLHGLIFQLPSVLPLPLHARKKDGDRRMETERWRQKDGDRKIADPIGLQVLGFDPIQLVSWSRDCQLSLRVKNHRSTEREVGGDATPNAR